MPIAQLMPLPVHWPYLPAIERLSLALALGLFVGLERQWRRKEAGLRTFGLASLLGCMGGLLGPGYALMGLGLLGLLVIFLNVQSLLAGQGTELTTSVALLVTGFTGVFCGLGHTLTPVAVSVVSAALLAWKEPMAGFSIGLTEAELRSAILLAILAFVIYPALPAGAVDPWGLVDLRTAWVTVLLIAGIGFANYVLLKLYGARGIELTGFLGGLVNSTVTVAELAGRVGETPELAEVAYRGVMIATAAMVVRNAALLALPGSASPHHVRAGPRPDAGGERRAVLVAGPSGGLDVRRDAVSDAPIAVFTPGDAQVRAHLPGPPGRWNACPASVGPLRVLRGEPGRWAYFECECRRLGRFSSRSWCGPRGSGGDGGRSGVADECVGELAARPPHLPRAAACRVAGVGNRYRRRPGGYRCRRGCPGGADVTGAAMNRAT